MDELPQSNDALEPDPNGYDEIQQEDKQDLQEPLLDSSGKACFNFGQLGHIRAKCTEPRVFSGTCKACNELGHMRRDCPANPMKCQNCQQTGHGFRDCQSPRFIDRKAIEDVGSDEALAEISLAVQDKDWIWAEKTVKKYSKIFPDKTYVDIQKNLLEAKIDLFLIALPASLINTKMLMDLQGNLAREFRVYYRFSQKCVRPPEQEHWPPTWEENLKRLENAGEPVDSFEPRCFQCGKLGHISKSCPQGNPTVQSERPTEAVSGRMAGGFTQNRPRDRNCYNCKEPGHISRECVKLRHELNGHGAAVPDPDPISELGVSDAHLPLDTSTIGGFETFGVETNMWEVGTSHQSSDIQW
ncbi:hypothetical protein BROUX41_001393 [Berkeleyomyces rouxiae]|uniref:uncharacterized protein n=1 Tax=Berkeleyomyces rouxiae TaxID=2035830 RepID=UPI003B7C84D8